ncbi:DUF4974 domain-containing protein [Aquimarina sp. U1-2]|uniref:FecR family protein n=1 Tax=Aquimarina sp. U1-2 TaxID=2823141 RepID=UPI001AEC8D23|nr:FecR family protein [Aquimarina sp. U1-2]MBP2830678.1 DUF4974 domain-containing protein [Aquimarina sp. U1-2]
MKKKKNIEDFLSDEEFVRWVKNPDPELDIFWLKWLQLYPEQRDVLMKSREIILSMKFKTHAVKATVEEQSLDHILSMNSIIKTPRKKDKTSTSFIFLKVAAIVIVLLSSTYLVNDYLSTPIKIPPQAKVSDIIKKNPNGRQSKIRLPDGSIVWLNAGSALSYPSVFTDTERVVSLDGQAFFEVVEDTVRPFRVNSLGLTTTALGTSFDVNAYSDQNKEVKISLVSGKISIENKSLKTENITYPGEQLIYSIKDQKSSIRSFDLKEVIAWKEQILYFKNASLSEVIQKLERWYGVEIQLKNRPSKNWNLTGEFKKQKLKRVLDRLSFIEDFNYKIKGKIIEFKF